MSDERSKGKLNRQIMIEEEGTTGNRQEGK